MAPHLDTIPSEILEDIAFHTSYDVRPRPPSDLISLLLVNRKLKSALSFHTTPHLYARIFTSKFDSEAHIRRLGPYKTQSNHLATELKRRFTVLRRVRAHEACSFPHSHPTGHDLEVIHEILWTVYVMMLENDGLNEKQLLEFAHINVWLGRFWFDSNGTSWAMKALDSDAWPPNHDIATLAMWNFWLLLRPDDYLTIGISQLRAMVAILKAFAIGAHKYTIIPDAFAKDSSPLHAPESLPSYGTYPPISPLPLALPAILSFLALVPLFSKRQATISDSIPTPSLSLCQKSPLSREWDNEWSRSALFADPMASVTPHSRPFLPGSVTGIWEGMFTYIDFSVYASLLGGATPSKLVATPAARHQQTFRLREYHLLNPGVGNFGDEPRPLSYGNPLRAGLPDEVEFILNGANLRVIEPGHPDIVYHLAPPCESTSADYVSRIRDVLIIGEGHSAWGQFNLLGRVKAQDGFISISKEYIDDDRGTWLYRGYLVGTKYGNLTGRWRDTLSPHDQLGYEGCFFMGRRT